MCNFILYIVFKVMKAIFVLFFGFLLRVWSGVQLHCCTSCLQALKMNSEPSSESMENSCLLHRKMKLTLHFLRNERELS